MHRRIVLALIALTIAAAPAGAQRYAPVDPCSDPVFAALARKPIGEMTRAEYQAFSELDHACRQFRARQLDATPTFQPQSAAPAPTATATTPLAYRKDPAAATLLSLPLAGAGHLYTGETSKGATLLGLYVLGQIVGYAGLVAGAADLGDPDAELWVSLGGFTMSAVSWVYGVFDARPSARRMNRLNGYPEPVIGGVRR